jgi:hypothetical protein
VFREEEFQEEDEGPTQPGRLSPLMRPASPAPANAATERTRATRPTDPLPLPRPPRR